MERWISRTAIETTVDGGRWWQHLMRATNNPSTKRHLVTPLFWHEITVFMTSWALFCPTD